MLKVMGCDRGLGYIFHVRGWIDFLNGGREAWEADGKSDPEHCRGVWDPFMALFWCVDSCKVEGKGAQIELRLFCTPSWMPFVWFSWHLRAYARKTLVLLLSRGTMCSTISWWSVTWKKKRLGFKKTNWGFELRKQFELMVILALESRRLENRRIEKEREKEST